MLKLLKSHPFPVKAHFDFSLVLTYSFPKEILEPLLPPHLELDTFNEQGFVAVAMVQTEKLRPSFFPAFMGNDFFLIGYRIFVKYVNKKGKRLRGLYILKSETNKKMMEYVGNIFTHYSYKTIDIQWDKNKSGIEVFSKTGKLENDFSVKVQIGENISLPVNSLFENWKEARRYAGPLPFTFDYEHEKKKMIIVEGVRENWVPEPVMVLENTINFLNDERFKGINPVLANAFVINNIPYSWKKGIIEKWD